MATVSSVLQRLGRAHRTFDCCDTTFEVEISGFNADAVSRRARSAARTLEAQLNAFAPDSAVSTLNETGWVDNEHVAAIVERGLEYFDRTAGRFDIHQGKTEHAVKAFIRREADEIEARFTSGQIRVEGSEVKTDVALDLNGLAKGYIVEWVYRELDGVGRRVFVNGGGDMTAPLHQVGIESPYGDDRHLRILDTDWAIASSGSYKRRRATVDHIYDPTAELIGARNDLVTVVARRDCMEADALATTLATMHPDAAIDVAERWSGAEAFLVHSGVFHQTGGFSEHVAVA